MLAPHVTRTVRRGDVLRHVTAGGGGYGIPSTRELGLIHRDVIDGKLTAEHVRSSYGVYRGAAKPSA